MRNACEFVRIGGFGSSAQNCAHETIRRVAYAAVGVDVLRVGNNFVALPGTSGTILRNADEIEINSA